MQINFAGRHLQITDDIRGHVKKRADKIEGVFSSIDGLPVVIEQEKNRYFTEMTLVARKATFHARIETHDIFESLHTALNRIETQIRRHKERVKDWRHRLSLRSIERRGNLVA